MNSVPEMKGLSRDEQRRLWVVVRRKMRASLFVLFGGFVVIALVPMAAQLYYRFRGPHFNYGLFCLVTGCCWLLIGFPIVIARARPHFRKILAGHCEVCGYDLRASPDRCPECGTIRSPGEARG